MSLIKCPVCKRRTADLADDCPHCGAALNVVRPPEDQLPPGLKGFSRDDATRQVGSGHA